MKSNVVKPFLILSLATLVIFNLACPSPRSQTTTVEVQHPPTRVVVRHTINWFAPVSNMNSYLASNAGKGVLDLSNPWEPDMVSSPYAIVKVTRADDTVAEETFDIDSVSGTVPAVDKDTTPYFFSITDTQSLADFISEESFGLAEAEVEIEFVFSIEQVDCEIPSGDYTSHLRFEDTLGVTYFDTWTLQYLVPNIYHGNNPCEYAEITLKQ